MWTLRASHGSKSLFILFFLLCCLVSSCKEQVLLAQKNCPLSLVSPALVSQEKKNQTTMLHLVDLHGADVLYSSSPYCYIHEVQSICLRSEAAAFTSKSGSPLPDLGLCLLHLLAVLCDLLALIHPASWEPVSPVFWGKVQYSACFYWKPKILFL